MRGARRTAVAVLSASLPALAQSGDVVVQAGPASRQGLSRDDSVAGTVVSGRRLQAPGSEAADVLRGLPGVTVTDTGALGALSTASVRGATSAQTPVYFAGIRLNDDVGGTADLSTVPMWLVDRVEVYRSNAPAQADRLAIGGAIFFDPRRSVRTGASGGLSVGSFGQRGARLGASVGGPGGGVLASIHAQEATNDYAYRDDRGTSFTPGDDRTLRRRNADVSTREVWVLGQATPGGSDRVLALAHAVEREQGVPGLGLLPTRAARTSLRRGLGAVRGEHRCDDDRCEVTVGTAAVVSDSTIDDPLRELGLGGPSLRSSSARVEQSALARIDLGERVELSAALNAAHERLDLDPEGSAARSSSRRFSRAALLGLWRLHSRVELRAVAAGECHGVAPGQLCDVAIPSGRLGALGRLGPGEWLANAGRYGRAPTLGERDGVSAVVRGNPELRPEGGTVVDAGYRVSASGHGGAGAALEFFVFAQWIDDLISYRRSSLGYLRPFNVGSTRTLGAEVAARAAPGRWLLASLALTALDPRDTSPGREGDNDLLPFRSRLQAAPAVEARLGEWPAIALSEATLEARYLHQSSRYADSSGQVVLAAQGSLDLELDTRWWRRLGARLRAANLLDQPRRDVVGYPLPGRSLFASAELSWP